jgi:hypothetical protein
MYTGLVKIHRAVELETNDRRKIASNEPTIDAKVDGTIYFLHESSRADI